MLTLRPCGAPSSETRGCDPFSSRRSAKKTQGARGIPPRNGERRCNLPNEKLSLTTASHGTIIDPLQPLAGSNPVASTNINAQQNRRTKMTKRMVLYIFIFLLVISNISLAGDDIPAKPPELFALARLVDKLDAPIYLDKADLNNTKTILEAAAKSNRFDVIPLLIKALAISTICPASSPPRISDEEYMPAIFFLKHYYGEAILPLLVNAALDTDKEWLVDRLYVAIMAIGSNDEIRNIKTEFTKYKNNEMKKIRIIRIFNDPNQIRLSDVGCNFVIGSP